MKVEEKLEELGYLIFTGENNVNIGCKYLNNTYIHMTIKNGKLYDFDVRGNLFIKHQSDIDNIQTAYNVLKSDLKELKNEYKNIQ